LTGRKYRRNKQRRTFAIISHPDAGKTTLTEKLLLFGGAIQMAGTVKDARRRARTSDWMRLEQQRGISVTSSVMQFPYRDSSSPARHVRERDCMTDEVTKFHAAAEAHPVRRGVPRRLASFTVPPSGSHLRTAAASRSGCLAGVGVRDDGKGASFAYFSGTYVSQNSVLYPSLYMFDTEIFCPKAINRTA